MPDNRTRCTLSNLAGRLRSEFAAYQFVDAATQIYSAIVTLLLLFRWPQAPSQAPWLVSAHLLGALLLHGLIQGYHQRPSHRALDLARHFYPLPLFILFYSETEALNQLVFSGYLDLHFLRWEQQLFGTQPSLDGMHHFPSRWVAELLFGAYFSFYLMIVGVGVALLARQREAFRHFMSVTVFVFYACYLAYIALPVVGPRVAYPGVVTPPLQLNEFLSSPITPPASVQSAVFYQWMDWIYRHFEGAGAAFPSSHVAVAIVTVWFSFRYLRAIRWFHAAAAALLCISTVYGRYHYVIDVIGGIATAVILIPIGNWLYFRTRS